MRYLSVLFAGITFIWWILLFVSIFVSPPGLHTRGSGFFDFSFTTLTFGMLLNSLIFFTTPATALRIETAITAVILLADVIIIAAVPKLRMEEGWVGIASVLWSFLMATWCIITDRVVAWGKREEEERLTGRPETRRTLAEWIAVLFAAIMQVIFIIIVIFMTATLILRSRDASLEMYGERYFVDDAKYEVHLACAGNVTYNKAGDPNPSLLLEAGEEPVEYDLEHWAYNAWKNGTIDRYCYWDRPGYAWSDNAPSPHSAGMSAAALMEALAQAGEDGPWILVSAGYGSLVSRIFSSRNLGSVRGMMLVDPLHEDLLYRIASPGRGFVLWGYGIISPLGIQRLIGSLFQGVTREDRIYGNRAYQGGKFIKAQLQENLVATSLTKNDVAAARTIQGRDLPLVVVSSGINVRSDREWEEGQQKSTNITDHLLDWSVVNKAPHQVWKTLKGREEMEAGLAKIVKAAAKKNDA